MRIVFIDQIKIVALSSDFDIIKGMGNYLQEKVVYLDVETSTNEQYYNIENPVEIKAYLENLDFECLSWGGNATFFNKRFADIKNNIKYTILGE